MKVLITVIGTIGLVFILAIIFSLPVMWLWNYLMPDLFALKQIGLWQAFCLLLLCGFLFKSSSSSSSKD